MVFVDISCLFMIRYQDWDVFLKYFDCIYRLIYKICLKSTLFWVVFENIE